MDAAWQGFRDCSDRARGCAGDDGGLVAQALTVFNSNICKQTAFLACRQAARDKFQAQATGCLVAALVTKSPLAFQACIAGAAAVELVTVVQCANTNSCAPPEVCVQEQCVVPPGIHVVSASYGNYCGNAAGNVTGAVASRCNGEVDCDVFVHNSVFGDPFYGCPKDFEATWTCGSDPAVRTASHGPVVLEGYTVPLTCR